MEEIKQVVFDPQSGQSLIYYQFHPISLCNTIYKVLTKAIVYRLKPVMPMLISVFQIGFIPACSIHENIIIAQELLHSM